MGAYLPLTIPSRDHQGCHLVQEQAKGGRRGEEL